MFIDVKNIGFNTQFFFKCSWNGNYDEIMDLYMSLVGAYLHIMQIITTILVQNIYISFSLILNISVITLDLLSKLHRLKLRWKYECLWFLLLKLICILNKMYSFNQIQSVYIVFTDLQNIRLPAWFVLIEYVDANS